MNNEAEVALDLRTAAQRRKHSVPLLTQQLQRQLLKVYRNSTLLLPYHGELIYRRRKRYMRALESFSNSL